MVVLLTWITHQFEDPQVIREPLDLISLAKWQSALGMAGEAEYTLLMASEQEMPLEHFHFTWHELGLLLKRAGRRQEAAVHWQQIAVTHVDGMTPGKLALEAHVELAKYFEWHQRDLKEAHRWTRQAISLPDDWNRSTALLVMDELQHRLARLERKISRHNASD